MFWIYLFIYFLKKYLGFVVVVYLLMSPDGRERKKGEGIFIYFHLMEKNGMSCSFSACRWLLIEKEILVVCNLGLIGEGEWLLLRLFPFAAFAICPNKVA
jgi:hypothetical protein